VPQSDGCASTRSRAAYCGRCSSASCGPRGVPVCRGARHLNGRCGLSPMRAKCMCSEVYRAYDCGARRHVALKILREEAIDNAEVRARFDREAWVTWSARSPCDPGAYRVSSGACLSQWNAARGSPAPHLELSCCYPSRSASQQCAPRAQKSEHRGSADSLCVAGGFWPSRTKGQVLCGDRRALSDAARRS